MVPVGVPSEVPKYSRSHPIKSTISKSRRSLRGDRSTILRVQGNRGTCPSRKQGFVGFPSSTCMQTAEVWAMSSPR